MKKFIFVAVAMLMTAFAANAQIGLEANAGLNVADLKVKDGGQIDSRVGFHAGLRANLDLSSVFNGFYANAGAILSLKGANEGVKYNPTYLEVPIHGGLQVELGDLGLFVEAGPYIGVGLFGNEKVSDVKHDFFSEDTFKRFDLGVGARAGVSIIEKYMVYVGYDLGLVNISQGERVKIHNTNLYFGVGYKF